MIQEYQLRVLPEVAANEQQLKEYLVQEKGLNVRNINATRILKRSIDARQRTIFVNLNVRVYLNEMPKDDEYQPTIYKNVEDKPQVIVVGAGPGGLFAALRLIEAGYCCAETDRTGTPSNHRRAWKECTRPKKRLGSDQPGAYCKSGIQL